MPARGILPEGKEAGGEGTEGTEGFSVPSGTTDDKEASDGGRGRPDACALLAGQHTVLFVGDSRMRAFFWHVLARMSGKAVAAHVNPSQWHLFGARAAAAAQRPGGGLGVGSNASHVGWCWQHPRGVSSQPLASCAGTRGVDLTRLMPEMEAGAVAMGRVAAAGGAGPSAAAGRLQAGNPSRSARHARVCATKNGEAAAGSDSSRTRTPSRKEGAKTRGPEKEESEGSEATDLSFIHTPSIESLLALFRAWAAEAESGAGEEDARGEPATRPLVVWAPPLQEVTQVPVLSRAKPNLPLAHA